MLGPELDPTRTVNGDFDYSTPEAQAALEGLTELVMDIRHEVELQVELSDRKVRLYERTLGLAVIPVLLRRAVLRRFPRLRKDQGRVR